MVRLLPQFIAALLAVFTSHVYSLALPATYDIEQLMLGRSDQEIAEAVPVNRLFPSYQPPSAGVARRRFQYTPYPSFGTAQEFELVPYQSSGRRGFRNSHLFRRLLDRTSYLHWKAGGFDKSTTMGLKLQKTRSQQGTSTFPVIGKPEDVTKNAHFAMRNHKNRESGSTKAPEDL